MGDSFGGGIMLLHTSRFVPGAVESPTTLGYSRPHFLKSHLYTLLSEAIAGLQGDDMLARDVAAHITIERTRDKQHGDFASSVALELAKQMRRKPRELAQLIVERLSVSEQVAKAEVAGPGFINFFMAAAAFQGVVAEILDLGTGYGRSRIGNDAAVQIEFVSANPNGPLHVGHGRGAAIGSTLANLLEAAGFKVQREYYVNDAGRQMDILTASVWLRYLELCEETVTFPSNGYKGDYVYEIARGVMQERGRLLCRAASDVLSDLPPDAAPDDSGDKEAHIDALITRAKTLLGKDEYRWVFNLALNAMLRDIRQDLAEFGVTFDTWFSERWLIEDGKVERAIERLKTGGYLYESGGAWWFRSTHYGDEKDRVVVRDNGQPTYFTSDIAYHLDKLEQRGMFIHHPPHEPEHRRFERIIDVWGADHHGYIPRVKAAMTALGQNPQRLEVVLVQFAILYRGGMRAQMSTRSGDFVTLRQLREEVGNDAARFFYVMRKSDQHLDFDLDLAKSSSNENPVYYIQYAHARICSVLREGEKRNCAWDEQCGRAHLQLLTEAHEQALMVTLSCYPEVVEQAALSYEPHQLAYYLRELATNFHTYYNAHAFLVESDVLRDARLSLLIATRQVLRNALDLLGVSAPETM